MAGNEAAHLSIVEGDGAGDAPRPRPSRTGPKWEADARERVRAAIRKFSRPLNDLVQRDANEGDTRLLVTDFLCEGLGFDKYTDLTTEYQVKGEFADYGIRIDKELVAFPRDEACGHEARREAPAPGRDVRRE